MENPESTRKAEPERISATDARDRLTDLMNRACFAGEQFILTKNGEPVAAIVGVKDLDRLLGLGVESAAVTE
jgi:prevent-host-death family protein